MRMGERLYDTAAARPSLILKSVHDAQRLRNAPDNSNIYLHLPNGPHESLSQLLLDEEGPQMRKLPRASHA